MPYSEEKKAVYIWIPKTAGTSMANGFKRRGVFENKGRDSLWGRIQDESDINRYMARNWQHVSAADAVQLLGQNTWDKCFTFSIVRNPYDRLVSFYEYSRGARKDPKSVQYEWPDPGTFEEWLEKDRPLSQLHYLTDENGRILVDFVGRFERLRMDVFNICFRLRVLPVKLPKLRASSRAEYHTYYTPQIRKKVEDWYGEEIEELKYKF